MPIIGSFGAGSARGYGQGGISKGLINATGGTSAWIVTGKQFL